MSKTLSETVAAAVDTATKKAVVKLAAREHRTEGAIVRLALAAYIEKEAK